MGGVFIARMVVIVAVGGTAIYVQPPVDPALAPSLTIAALNETPVTGRLGVPLGKAITIRGVVVAGSLLGEKYLDGCYLLRVTEVDGKRLANPEILTYTAAPGYSGLPRNSLERFQRLHARKPSALSEVDEQAVGEGFVGTERQLLVYETGGFDGIPRLPPQVREWTDRPFAFRTHLVILQDD